MPIHIMTRNKQDIVTFLSNVDPDFVSLVDHGANWTPFTLIKSHSTGVSPMPGQVIQAIIMPLETDITELERLYGQEWFSRVNTSKREEFAAKARYVQREESDFEEFQHGAAFVLKDIANTGGHFVVGTLKAGNHGPSLKLPPRVTTPDFESAKHHKGDMSMTDDEVKKLVADGTAAATARMMEQVEKRLATLATEPAAQSPDTAVAHSKDAGTSAGKSAAGETQDGIMQRLDDLNARIESLAEKQAALEHAAVGLRSTPEDASIKRGLTSPFRGMFAGL